MNILEKIDTSIPFKWFDYDYWPDSNAFRVIFQLANTNESKKRKVEQLVAFVIALLKTSNERGIVIGQAKPDIAWGEMTMDSWSLVNNEFVFEGKPVSKGSKKYLNVLIQSGIDFQYEGLCKCNNWDAFLKVVVECVLSGITPFSPLIYDLEKKRVIYFHHTFSVGVYCESKADADLLSKTCLDYGMYIEFFNQQ